MTVDANLAFKWLIREEAIAPALALRKGARRIPADKACAGAAARAGHGADGALLQW